MAVLSELLNGYGYHLHPSPRRGDVFARIEKCISTTARCRCGLVDMFRRFQFRPERFGADFVVMKMHRMTLDRLGTIKRRFFGNPNHGYLRVFYFSFLNDVYNVSQFDAVLSLDELKQIRLAHTENSRTHEENNQLT